MSIEKLFLFPPNPFCIFLAEIKLMQKLLLPFLLLAVTIAFGQSKYMTKSGSMSFEASQPTFEPIEATHSAVSALLNADTGELAVLALVRGFRFPLALMEEHFNENYIESHQYPKTSFKGSITDFDTKPPSATNRKLLNSLVNSLCMGSPNHHCVCYHHPNQMNKSLWRLPFRSKHQTLALKSQVWFESKSMKTYKLRCLYPYNPNKPL